MVETLVETQPLPEIQSLIGGMLECLHELACLPKALLCWVSPGRNTP
jgi:hypothetical protein